jgi:alkylation response protein AidB-like acyl-CoA dehydrogenase
VPFLTSSVIATTALLDSDSTLLEHLAAGERVAALAVPWSTAPDVELPAVRLEGGRLTGTITSVAGAIEADVLLVAAGSGLYAVDVSAVTLTPRVCLDMTRQLADVTLDGAAGALVLADAGPAVRRALDSGAALMASEQLGLARWCLETTVAYLKVRTQFGRVLGGFQALKHRLADLYADVESGAAAARYAAATLAAADPDATVATSIAQAYNSDLAVRAAEEAVQLHGGIGMTWEHPAHLYLKRAKADQIALGTPGRHRARLGALIDLGA